MESLGSGKVIQDFIMAEFKLEIAVWDSWAVKNIVYAIIEINNDSLILIEKIIPIDDTKEEESE